MAFLPRFIAHPFDRIVPSSTLFPKQSYPLPLRLYFFRLSRAINTVQENKDTLEKLFFFLPNYLQECTKHFFFSWDARKTIKVDCLSQSVFSLFLWWKPDFLSLLIRDATVGWRKKSPTTWIHMSPSALEKNTYLLNAVKYGGDTDMRAFLVRKKVRSANKWGESEGKSERDETSHWWTTGWKIVHLIKAGV